MNDLTPEKFSDFFAAVNDGHAPFPWQQRLVDQLFADNGRWPHLLDLPTGSGKTSTVDIALYTLAAGLPVPRRIVFVVDRRVIVQQAAVHAAKILDRVDNPDEPILHEIRAALFGLHAQSTTRSTHPFELAELRGAIEQNRTWSTRADIPAVIASTVDQVGSRLLYRGYGISDRMKPVHAGLVGNDTLILLDEVHLARPFADLLSTIRKRFRPTTPSLPDRWQVVELSATPSTNTSGTERFSIDRSDYADPELGLRLGTSKPVRTVAITLPAAAERQTSVLAKEHATQAIALLKHPSVTTIAVVVNRVQLAIAVVERLRGAADVVILITGRMRGIDREQAMKELTERAGAGRERKSGTTIVVATQTIEAGADLDFDAIVTDCASIDALIQRLGRVDRLGRLADRLGDADHPSSVVIGSPRFISSTDPIYGDALGRTWEWLTEQTSLDFGPSELIELRRSGVLSQQVEQRLTVERPRTMRLLSNHLDRLVRTSPIPDADVDIDLFLHGLDHQPNQEVDVVWRADITQSMLFRTEYDGDTSIHSDPAITTLIEALPPLLGEAMPLPINHVRNWLNADNDFAKRDLAELSDIESSSGAVSVTRGWIRPCILARGQDTVVTTTPSAIRPGDTIVVPAEYGGIADRNWAPNSVTPVEDLCEVAGIQTGILRIRLNPAIVTVEDPPDSASDTPLRQEDYAVMLAQLQRPDNEDTGEQAARRRIPTPAWVVDRDYTALSEVREWLQTSWKPLAPTEHHTLWDSWRHAIAIDAIKASDIHPVISEFRTTTRDRQRILVYIVTKRLPTAGDAATTGRGSSRGGQYDLANHLHDVARWAMSTAKAVGIEDPLRADIVAAARLHDLGKADPRFQLYLREGRLMDGGRLLAKSDIPYNDHRRHALARERSGYPSGIRHEAASVALVAGSPTTTRYLIASHHGYARPFFKPQLSEQITIQTDGLIAQATTDDPYTWTSLGGGSADDFGAMVAEYGYFGVGWLEAVMRLADHGASAEIENKPTEGGHKS